MALPTKAPQKTERVQKIIAHAGVCSRREAEKLIEEGLVTVNGAKIGLGDRADPSRDAIKVKGKLLQKPRERLYFAFNKPPKVLSIMRADPERGRKTLIDFLRRYESARLIPVGKVEFTGEGLILLTNDGQAAHDLLSQESLTQKFHIKVKGHPKNEVLDKLTRGGRVLGKLVYPESIKVVRRLQSKDVIEATFRSSLSISMTEIKKFFANKGLLVERMVRTQIGPLTLSGIPAGHGKVLNEKIFREMLAVEAPPKPSATLH